MTQLIDRFQRSIDYIRISVTDRCDFRCVYCMEEKVQFIPRNQLLNLDEIYTIAKAFTELGVKKIRITGGEPLVRHNVLELLNNLGQLNGLRELVLTTNGSQLAKLAKPIQQANVKRINISLDSLDPIRFRKMTRVGDLQKVLDGIEAARQANFKRIKINTVILKNRNHDEIIPLVNFAITNDLDISFIEEMPLGINSDHDRAALYYSSDNIREDIQQKFELIPSTETTGGPAKYFRIPKHNTRIGFISPHSHNFCSQCNRVRLTCQGRLLLCLGQEHSVDLKQVLRDTPKLLKQKIQQAMLIKPEKHEFNLNEQPVILRHMNLTGG